MGAIAATRFAREPDVPLRPMGDCDVVTLLASRSFRAALCVQQPMRAAAVPMRTRGWLDPSRVDPAFAVTAAQLTGPEDRGFERPILITADEVVLSVDFGHDRVVRQVLRDTCAPDPVLPNVRYR